MNEKQAVIAIDIGGSTTKLACIDSEGEVCHWRSLPTSGPDPGPFLDRVLRGVLKILSEASQPVLGVSLAMAGFVSRQGTLTYNPNLAWLEHAPLADRLRDALHLPVSVETDSNAACAGEYLFGQGRGASRFLCLTGGTGLGVGMVIDGRLLRFAHGGMGDAGHIILSPTGPLCTCGGRGCAEAFLSTALLGHRYSDQGGGSPSFRSLVEAAKGGEPRAIELLAEAGHWLGIAAASLSHLFFPDRIAVAGGLCQAGDPLFVAAAKALHAYGGNYPLAGVSLVRASTGEHATLVGAAACFFSPELRA